MTFEEVFARDYSNVTIGSIKYVNGVYSVAQNKYNFVEEDSSLTAYTYSPGVGTGSGWNGKTTTSFTTAPRIDMIFALSADIFEQASGNTYVAANNEVLIPILSYMLLTSSMKINTLRDYSISLTMSAGRIQTISFSYYSGTGTLTATSGTLQNKSFTLSDFGTTEFDYEIPEELLALREPVAEPTQLP